uniref:Uncharacterized protein n=1 Tax=Kalanchoe fedtschenkoi TaxID=63787 RepID=A0A7N0TM55_KALFE
MTMISSVHGNSTHLCTQQHHLYSAAAGYGGEIESMCHRFRGSCHNRSTSFAPSSCHNNINNSQAAYTVFDNYYYYFPADQMGDREEFRPENDPNQPSSSSMEPGANDSWLRLRLGGHDQTSSGLQSQPHQPTTPDTRNLVELDLLPGSSRDTNPHHQQAVRNTGPPAYFQAQEFRAPPRQVAWLQSPAPEINWALMRPSNIMTGQQQKQLGNYYVPNPSVTLMPMGPNFFARPYGNQMGLNGGDEAGGGGTSSSSGGWMRIVRPPRRPHVGIWFMLQASQNQVREPFLPQIPKSYLRIKDGRMTVRLLIKYLVHKLRLESESEVGYLH